jgi:hypothetical protein
MKIIDLRSFLHCKDEDIEFLVTDELLDDF